MEERDGIESNKRATKQVEKDFKFLSHKIVLRKVLLGIRPRTLVFDSTALKF